jgi:DNA-nicking Smr family endonuclease
MRGRRGGVLRPPIPSEEDIALFREAVGDARPLPPQNRAAPAALRPIPVPHQTLRDERQALAESLSDHISWLDGLETGEELVFLRPGLSPQVLRRLRRGHWVIQAELDLHGMTSNEAREQVVAFLNECVKRGLRCVRVIHGKGLRSKNKEPVLKLKVANWLRQRDEILAFCQAQPADGGSGAAIVLLRGG